MKQKDLHYLAFDKNWFQKHQKILLWIFNLVYKIYPSLFFKSREQDDFEKNKIIEVGHNHATCDAGLQYFKKSALYETASKNPENNHRTRRIYKKLLKKIEQGKIQEELKLLPARKTIFFTDWNYSKMLYNAFKPMWWAMHWWDELFADRLVPQLSFGFDTLEFNPNADPETTSVDGYLDKGYVATWAEAHDATTGGGSDSAANSYLRGTYSAGNGYYITRAYFLFDTSSLTSDAIISTAEITLYSSGDFSSGELSSLDIVSSSPASNTELVGNDYDNIGSTAFSTKTLATWGASNVFNLDSNGINNISLTNISKFGGRIKKDTDNSAPTGANYCYIYFSDNGSNKPKLVVTYTLSAGPANLKTYNTNSAANIKSINTNLIANVKSLNTNV